MYRGTPARREYRNYNDRHRIGDTWWKKLGHYRNYTYDTTTVNATTTTDTTSIEFPRNNNNYNYREQEESWLDRWFFILFYFWVR